jgi:DNA-binding response OmpR family regulator
MSTDYKIFIVDDDETIRLLLESMLVENYALELFDSAESCLARMESGLPDLFLLDVGLPGIDGFELCRRIKASSETAALPVLFISAEDSLQDVLTGYDAGAEDYIVKPFDVIGLSHKVANLRRIQAERQSLAAQAQASDELASIVLANLDEYAVLIKFLRTLNECTNYRDVVDAVLKSLEAFHLDGAVQVRMRNLERTFSRAGENWPLEISVINHVRNLDRIFEFKTRCAYNFGHVTILVTNMPVADSELCGRIRDHLAIVAESVDAKLAALQAAEDKAAMRGEIHGLLDHLGETVRFFASRYDRARYSGSIYAVHFQEDLLASFAHLGMTDMQEESILELVKRRVDGLIDLYDFSGETESRFEGVRNKLEAVLAATN